MSATFLDRNKKKSLLAALLLFLRQRKMLVLLLFLVLVASTVFLSPSSWITSLPGGERFAAGVAWIAGKMGVDVSKWGLGPAGKHSYDDLLLAFREARAAGQNGAGVGWGAFFGRGGAGGAGGSGSGSGAAPSSLDFVKGSKSDLEHGMGAGGGGAAGGGTQSVAGIVDPADPKGRDGNGVAISEDDLGGQREGFLKEAFAGGFMNGALGGAGAGAGGSGGDGSLSGGAYASKGFFSGSGGASGTPGSLAKSALAGLPPVATPSSVKGGPAKGSLSSMASRAVEARATKGVLGAGAIGGNLAYTQLAEGGARASMVSPDCVGTSCCKAPDCPSEFAATNTGAIYDGNNITSGFLTSSDPGANSAGLINSTVDVPPISSTDQGDQNAAEIGTCETDAMSCETAQQTLAVGADGKGGFKPFQDQINIDAPKLPGACDRVCSCGGCNSLNQDLNNQCAGISNLSNQISQTTCNMPADCASLGVTPPPANMQNVGGTCPGMKCNECPHVLGICMCFLMDL